VSRHIAATFVLASFLAVSPGESSEPEAVGQVSRLPSTGSHWVWVPDRLFGHSLLYNGDDGRVLATVDSHAWLTPKLPLVARTRKEVYSLDVAYSRGRRGTRTDYVTIYDSGSLEVVGEILLRHPIADSNASVAHGALLDDDRFLLVFSQFPATLVSVIDLEHRRVVAEVPIAGCAGVYAAGPQSFGTLCGDGTLFVAYLDAAGALERTTRSEPFFDAVEDPVFMASARIDSGWVFTSFAGLAHQVDLSTEPPSAEAPWSLVDDAERLEGWRPGGLQHVALHERTRQLYVVMHQGGSGSHKDAGPEIWRYDLERHARTGRIQVPNLAADFIAPLMGLSSEGIAAWLLRLLMPSPGAHTIAITQDERPLLFARNAQLGVVAVLDPASGEHLRNLEEAGFAGPTLGVP